MSFFSDILSPKQPKVTLPPPPPKEETQVEDLDQRRRKRTLRSTIATSPRGVLESGRTAAPGLRKTLG